MTKKIKSPSHRECRKWLRMSGEARARILRRREKLPHTVYVPGRI